MPIEIDKNFKLVRCAETGTESRVFTPPQWAAFEVIFSNAERIVTYDEIVNAVYTDDDILYGGVSDQAVVALIRRVRQRIDEVSPWRDYIVTQHGWGYRYIEAGVPRERRRKTAERLARVKEVTV